MKQNIAGLNKSVIFFFMSDSMVRMLFPKKIQKKTSVTSKIPSSRETRHLMKQDGSEATGLTCRQEGLCKD